MIRDVWIEVPGFAEGHAVAEFFLTDGGFVLDTLTVNELEMPYEDAERFLGKDELKRIHDFDYSDAVAAHAVDQRAQREDCRV